MRVQTKYQNCGLSGSRAVGRDARRPVFGACSSTLPTWLLGVCVLLLCTQPMVWAQGAATPAAQSAEGQGPARFVLRADGSIIARRDRGGLFGGGFEALAVMPGDTVVVPAQIDRETRYNAITRGLKDWTSILANFGLGMAALKTLK